MSTQIKAKWYVGCDHAGVALKASIVGWLQKLGDDVVDLGPHTAESVDYPDYGAKIARAVVAEAGSLGIAICGSGIGISIAANKVSGARAALCTHGYMARMAREHNDANILALGARIVGEAIAEDCVMSFRAAQFAGGRHATRVAKIAALETNSERVGA